MAAADQILPSRSAYFHPARRPAIVRGKGAWLFADDGSRYFDAACGSGSLIFGHGDADMADIVARQSADLTLFPARAFGVEVVEDYMRRLVAFAPEGLTHALTLSSGSDAVEAALKAALQYHHAGGDAARVKFIGREGSYHGNTLAGLAAGGFVSRRMPYEGALPQWAKACVADGAQGGNGGQGDAVDSVEQAILAEGAGTVAAVIMEPVVGAALSAVAPNPAYVAGVRAVCDAYGVLLIADEVMTGFGRTGLPFACSGWPVLPDIVVAGKAISAGYYPLSAVLVRDAVAERLAGRGGYFENGQTNCCNPVGAAVGAEVVRRLSEPALLDGARRTGETLRRNLSRRVAGEVIANVRGVGMMIGFDVALPAGIAQGANAAPGDLLYRAAIAEGLVVYPSRGGPRRTTGDHAMLLPPLVTSEAEVDHMVDALARAVHRVLDAPGAFAA